MTKAKSYINRKFNMLTVISDPFKDKWRFNACIVRCDCGVEKTVIQANVVNNRIKSCGCARYNFIKGQTWSRTHNLSHSKEYRIWVNIKSRCFNDKKDTYALYGAKGITMCDEWKLSFESFFSYIGQQPTPQHTVDRIDNSKGYEPGNVRWATRKEQANNTRSNLFFNFDGHILSLKEFADKLGISYSCALARARRHKYDDIMICSNRRKWKKSL